MTSITEYLERNINLSARVSAYADSLNQNGLGLNILIQQLELLFVLFQRSETLARIIRDYSKNFKNDIGGFKQNFVLQENFVKNSSAQLSNISTLLKTIDEMLMSVQEYANQFVTSSRSLARLAKNAEIKSYQAQAEGRGLAVIARESLSLANRAQAPFEDFEMTLRVLKETAQPVVEQLGTIIEISQRSTSLLTRVMDSLKIIDDTVSSLQKIIISIEQQNALYNDLKNNVSNEVGQLKEQLATSQNTIDDMSVKCAEINSLAQILHTLGMIMETDGHPDSDQHIVCQFNHALQENTRLLDRLPAGRKPPLFLHRIYANIQGIVAQIEELNRSTRELALFGDNLYNHMNEIVELEGQLDTYHDDAMRMVADLNRLGTALDGDLARIEGVVLAAGKIFSKIKTLSVFARIEESRCMDKRAVISPVVQEFTDLAINTEKPFMNMGIKLSQLKKDVHLLSREALSEIYVKPPTPDYSKIKIFLDDMVRVLQEKSKAAGEIMKITQDLTNRNASMRELGELYDEALNMITQLRKPLEHLARRKPVSVPAVSRSRIVIDAELKAEPVTIKPDLVTDVNSHNVVGNVHSGLFQFGEGVDVIPGLCQEYTISRDGTEYVFRLKEGLKYHNGNHVMIEDVRDGFLKALQGPNFNLFEMIAGAGEYISTKQKERLRIRIIDNHHLQVKIEYPYLPFLANLATHGADPYIPGEYPLSAGPFKIAAWERGKLIILEANEHYFEGRPTIDMINFHFQETDEDSYDRFMKGILSVYRPTAASLLKLRRKYPDAIFTIPELSIQFLCMNCTKSPFNNRLVRKALAHAIDTKNLVKNLLEGSAVPAKGIFPPSMRVHNPRRAGYQFNPQKSRDLLVEAGFKHGLPDTYPLDLDDSPPVVKRGEFIKDHLEKVGIRIELNPLPWRTLLDKTYKGHSVLSLRGWVSDNGDPDNFMYPLFHSSSFGSSGNTFFFNHPGVDSDIVEGRKIRNINQRILHYQQLEHKILDEMPGVFLYHSLENVAIQRDIIGFKPHPLGLLRFKFVYLHETG
jgi:peptide/nickel transport system substrate-binding protein